MKSRIREGTREQTRGETKPKVKQKEENKGGDQRRRPKEETKGER